MYYLLVLIIIAIVANVILTQKKKREESKIPKEVRIHRDAKAIIKDWVLCVDDTKSLSDDIVALNFGLFEGEKFYEIYISGSKVYDENDDDWRCEEDFETCFRYCPNVPFPTESIPWEEFLDKVIVLIKEVIKETPDLRLWKVEHITVGFDDGDLVKIK